MCEVGVWKSFDELEENICLDELWMLFEQTYERHKRLAEVVGAALGASPSGSGGGNGGVLSGDKDAQAVSSSIIDNQGRQLFGYEGPQPD